MAEQSSPFLSAAVLRRILKMHSFSEANRAYLLREADQRELWEQEVAALVSETSPPAGSFHPLPFSSYRPADMSSIPSLPKPSAPAVVEDR